MTTHHRKIKLVQFSLNGNSFECQVQNWNLDPGVAEAERMYAQCPEGAFFEEPTPEGTLQLTFYSDWRSDGISDFLTQNSGTLANFTIDHHPDIVDEHVRWTGQCRLYAPPVNAEARSTEMTEVTLQILGDVTDGYGRVAA